MTFEYMDEILDIRIQLHEYVTIIYVVDGFEATLNTQDGRRPSFTARGTTPMDTLQKLVVMLKDTPAFAGAGARGSAKEIRSDDASVST